MKTFIISWYLLIYTSCPQAIDEYGKPSGYSCLVDHLKTDGGHRREFVNKDSATKFYNKIKINSEEYSFPQIVQIKIDSIIKIK